MVSKVYSLESRPGKPSRLAIVNCRSGAGAELLFLVLLCRSICTDSDERRIGATTAAVRIPCFDKCHAPHPSVFCLHPFPPFFFTLRDMAFRGLYASPRHHSQIQVDITHATCVTPVLRKQVYIPCLGVPLTEFYLRGKDRRAARDKRGKHSVSPRNLHFPTQTFSTP
jgi:hypothetical protein